MNGTPDVTFEPAAGLVGREHETQLLDREIGRLCAGELRVVVVEGAAGVGKTRLISEVLDRHRSEVTALAARSFRLGATASCGPWLEALDRHLYTRSSAELERICGASTGQLAPYLSVLDDSRTDPSPQRAGLLEAVADVLRRLSDEGPLVVWLDDIHLADFSSWEALRFIGRRLASRSIGVFATARPAQLRATPVAAETLIGLQDDRQLRRISLAPLTHDGVAQLAAAYLGEPAGSVPAPLVQWLFTRSLGHPLFALGLLRALVAEGADLAAPALDRVPENLRDRVTMEVGFLQPQDRALLEALSVVDQRAGADDLADILGHPVGELTDSFERLSRSGLVVEHPLRYRATYEIAHPLVQDSVYQAMLGARRQSLHRAIARAFHARGRIAASAAHIARASSEGDTESVAVLCEAMRQAEERGLYQEALAVLGALVDILPEADQRWNRVLDAMHWQADWVVGHLAEADSATAVTAMRRIQSVAAGSDDLTRRATVALHLASFLSIGAGELDQAELAARAAADLFSQAGDQASSLLARNELAWIAGCAGDLRRQARLSAEVVAEVGVPADGAGDGRVRALIQSAGTAGYALGLLGEFDRAEEMFQSSISLAERRSYPYRATWGRVQLGYILALYGRLAEATRLIDFSSATDRRSAADAIAPERLAVCQWMAGALREAVSTVNESAARRAMVGSVRRAWAAALAARVYGEFGEPDRAANHLQLAARTYRDGDVLTWGVWWRWVDGVLSWQRGRHPHALAQLQRAHDALRERSAVAEEPLLLIDGVQVACDGGAMTPARRWADRLAEVAAATGAPLAGWLSSLATALVCLQDGELDGASAGAEEAAAGLRSGGYRLNEAIALETLGRAYVPTDDQLAAATLQRAARRYEECGASWRLERALERLAQLGRRGRRFAAAVRGPGALTGRELEVVQLAARGLTAEEIADRLYIGRRTVESHLAHAYPKLGVDSKRDLVRRAGEFGLDASPNRSMPPDPVDSP
jgi:ATP/maltotriose-dependent transcriptional regulator MalT